MSATLPSSLPMRESLLGIEVMSAPSRDDKEHLRHARALLGQHCVELQRG
jgi:hypothetical protein